MENTILKSNLVQISVKKATELTEISEYCIRNGVRYEVLGGYLFIDNTDVPRLIEGGYISDEDDRDPSAYQYGE